MSTKRIEQLIEDIYEFIESCKPQAFSSAKVIVPKDELYDLLDELRLKMPVEVKRCQQMIAQRDAIMTDAKNKAAVLEEETRKKAATLINENEIMQQAYYQANEVVRQANEQADEMYARASNAAEEILARAKNDAEDIRRGALGSMHDIIKEAEGALSSAYSVTREKSEEMLEALRQNLENITKNRKELQDSLEAAPGRESAAKQEEYGFSEDDFLDGIE